MLKCITRGNVNPSGKQKIYYASTIEDKGGIYDTSRHILTYYDMAIYYEEDGDTSKTSDAEICSMDCIILLLTEQTTKTRNDVVDRVLPLALKNRIPMLPLGITPEVGPLVGELCELKRYPSLDVLFPNDDDKTKVPFRERLQNWMSKFMTGSEEHQRILENFQTRVFISYRKKDRQILRKLLSDIYHKADYRESLIWFDEYLTAGEDYNIEIQNMIDSSNLFIFLLTENMLEPDNYAIREELSRAMEKKKPILVINTLNEIYRIPQKIFEYKNELIFNIPIDSINCSAKDFSEIGNALSKILPKPMYSNLEEKLEYIYLIGMAYYLGIGALKDEEYGLKLICHSAKNGLIEAMDRMVTILIQKYGDYSSAIKYQKVITDYYRDIAIETEEDEDLECYLDKLEELGDFYKCNGDIENHEESFLTMIAILESVSDLEGRRKLLFKATEACTRLGDVADLVARYYARSSEEKTKCFNKAVDWYLKGYDYALCYQKFGDSLKARRLKYTQLMRIADESIELKEESTEDYIEEYLSILKQITDADNTYHSIETRADLYACHKILMELFHTADMTSEALYSGQKMVDLAKQVYLESHDIQRLQKYTEAMESFADLLSEYGQTKEALQIFIIASKARLKYTKCQVNDPKSVEVLFNDYISIVDLCIDERRTKDARDALESAKNIAIDNNLADNIDIKAAIISRLIRLGLDQQQ